MPSGQQLAAAAAADGIGQVVPAFSLHQLSEVFFDTYTETKQMVRQRMGADAADWEVVVLALAPTVLQASVAIGLHLVHAAALAMNEVAFRHVGRHLDRISATLETINE